MSKYMLLFQIIFYFKFSFYLYVLFDWQMQRGMENRFAISFYFNEMFKFVEKNK